METFLWRCTVSSAIEYDDGWFVVYVDGKQIDGFMSEQDAVSFLDWYISKAVGDV